MNGNCHLVFGTSVGIAIALNLKQLSEVFPLIENSSAMAALFIEGGIIGGVFPDIDNPTSFVGKLTKPVSTIIAKISESFGKTGSNHRGIFHELFVYAFGLYGSLFFFPALCGFFVGALSHLYLDFFTPAGVPFFLASKNLRFGIITSNQTREMTIFTWTNVILVLGVGIWFRLT